MALTIKLCISVAFGLGPQLAESGIIHSIGLFFLRRLGLRWHLLVMRRLRFSLPIPHLLRLFMNSSQRRHVIYARFEHTYPRILPGDERREIVYHH